MHHGGGVLMKINKDVYDKLFDQANKLSDFVDGDDPYEDRIKKLPELIAMVEQMRTIENENDPNFKRKRFNDIKTFLSFFPGLKTFQTFDDDSNRKAAKLARIKHCLDEEYNGVLKCLNSLNEQGAGVYLCINETNGAGRKADNIIKVRAVFADLDGAILHPVWEYEPSLVVESSPGKFHVYWCVDDEKFMLEGFCQVQESIAAKFSADPKIKDLPRVMRMPGFYHKKHEPYMTSIIYTSDKKYDFKTLSEMFPPAPREQWSAERYKSVEYGQNGEFKGHYGASEGERNCHITKRIGGCLKRGLAWYEIEAEAFKEGMACKAPSSEKEVLAILKSCRRYG